MIMRRMMKMFKMIKQRFSCDFDRCKKSYKSKDVF